MRLLQRQSDGALSLTENRIDDIPPYAILSHTWGADDQEVTFQDIQKHEGQHKEGYRKLTFCADQATADGLNYFWVDTCCIDKPNHTELSEAINSMFRWYQNATKCYVYLSDVSLRDTDAEETPWEPAFRKSRWFTRGWTLQELIAPKSVSFFSKEGQRLGNKATLEALLHEITRIPIDALRGNPLADFSINDRFSWLGNRQTKRAEDRAYSLFGIFDVQLPLIYSEGEEKAFRRLRQEIGRDTVSETSKRCIGDLRVTDPRHDKTRIQETKGGLLVDSYVWVLNNSDFRQWRDDRDQRLLWVKGDPGKGKTMLLCGIIDELEKSPAEGSVLAYFFCQATDERINTATAAVRGLISMLLEKDVTLVSHIEKKYGTAGKALFEDTNAWQALCEIFTNILQDSRLKEVCLVVDALDECIKGLPQLLEFIIQTSRSSRAKWLVSSRNWPQIEESLRNVAQRLSLEINAVSVAAAVDSYITVKVSQLTERKGYRDSTADEVRRYLSSNADGTFLWVALVCQELEKTRRGNASQKVKLFPSGLNPLYQQMMQQIHASEDAALCTQVLALLATTYRPPSLVESTTLIEESFDMADDPESLQEIISLCGSFITIREDTIYFVHQSAKEYLIKEQYATLFPQGQTEVHARVFSTSIKALSLTLRRDIYKLCDPGFHIEDVARPTPDPLATVAYSCVYWVNHLIDSGQSSARDNDVRDEGEVDRFLRSKLLYWIESLSLLGSVSEGMLALKKITDVLKERPNASQLQALVLDAYRLLQTFRPAIQSWPLQTYTSALVFSPAQSPTKKLFRHEEPKWVQSKTRMADQWSACEMTLEGHSDWVCSAAFSADGQRVVTASCDNTVKVWNLETGACEATLNDHTAFVNSAAFSVNGQRVVSASDDGTIKVWNMKMNIYEATLKGHSHYVNSAAFSADDWQVVSASSDNTVKVWNIQMDTCKTLKDHTFAVRSAAFSTDRQRVVSASGDKTVKIWDVETGACKATLAGHGEFVNSAAFSTDGKHIVSASDDKTVKIWNALTGACEATLDNHTAFVNSAAFSVDGQRVVSASDDGTIKVWNMKTSTYEATLKGHSYLVKSAAFSIDGQRIVSASSDKTVKIWNVQTGAYEATLEGHGAFVNSTNISADGQQVVTASSDKTVKVWNVETGACKATLEGHKEFVNSAAFSLDGHRVVSASGDGTIKVWSVAMSACKATLKGHGDSVRSAAFSMDGQHIVSASSDKTVKVWDLETCACLGTYEVGYTSSVSFDPTGTLHTNAGNIRLDESITVSADSHTTDPTQKNDYGLSPDRLWVLKQSKAVLWLPPEYRPISFAVYAAESGTSLVLGCSSGRVYIFWFTPF